MRTPKCVILIVEDEVIIALETENRLKKLGYQVIGQAASGKKAIEILESKKTDLVIMDIRIQGAMDGIETADIIRTRFEIPVVFLTAFMDEEKLKKVKLTRPFGYLLKPVKDRELKVAVEMALYTASLDRERKKVNKNLRERIKELECFYGISKLAETPDLTQDDLLKGVIELISKAWQYPEVTHSRIEFNDGRKILCPHGLLTINEAWSQSANITVHGKKTGRLLVFYSDERPAADEKVFLKEERRLLNALAEHIGRLIERMEYREALQKTEKTLQSIVENSPNVYFSNNTDHVLTYLSPQVKDILGYDPEEMMVPWTELITDDPINKAGMMSAQRAIDTGIKQAAYELQLFHKSGRKIWCEIREAPILVDGKTTSIVGSLVDITDRKEAENFLRISEKRYQRILDSSPIGIQISDVDGIINYSNAAHQRLHGRSREEIIGRYVWDFNTDPDQQTEEKERYFQDIKSKSDNIEMICQDKTCQGKKYDVILNRCNIYSDNQEVEAVCTFITDVGSIRETERALKENEEKYHILFDLESDALALIEIDSGNMVEVNRAFIQLYGYSKSEVLSMKNTDFSVEPDKTREATVQLKTSVPVRWHKKKDGTVFPTEIIANVFDYKGKKVHIAAIRDISERIAAEKQIGDSLKEKDTLLQEIHHRVKNNLAVVTSLLKLQSAKAENENAKKVLQDSQNRLQAMSLVHKFLYQSENLAEINAKDYLTDLVFMIKQSFGTTSRNIKTTIEVENLTFNADIASPLGLIVNELITNSLKYAFPDNHEGHICICFGKSGERDLKLVVYDNGIGMPADFDWQNGDSLGLSLVKTLARDQLDGSIEMDSVGGASFTILFPDNEN